VKHFQTLGLQIRASIMGLERASEVLEQALWVLEQASVVFFLRAE